MKNLLTTLLLCLTSSLAMAQCNFISVQISSSDSGYVQLYNAGFFLISPGAYNVYVWEARDFSGNIIHQDTTMGNSTTSLFSHSVPVSDSIFASIEITNDTAGIVCLMQDTLVWEEITIGSSSFGNWTVLSNNGGTIVTSISAESSTTNNPVILFPSAVGDYFEISGPASSYDIRVLNLKGQQQLSLNNISSNQQVDASSLKAGVYFVQFWNAERTSLEVKKIVKL